ncbi:MAG: DUF167 family protein [Pseudomonadota bacterium]
MADAAAPAAAVFWETAPAGLRLRVRVTPRGGRDSVDGPGVDADGRAHLRVRVAAPPAEGAANTAVCACLAKAFGVPRRAVALVAGAASRVKTVEIAGPGAELALRAAALVGR